MARILPDFQREKDIMAGDRREYGYATKELMNIYIHKTATIERVKIKEREFEREKVKIGVEFERVMGVGDMV